MSQAAGTLSLRLNCWGRQERMCHIKEKEQTKCPTLKKHWSRGEQSVVALVEFECHSESLHFCNLSRTFATFWTAQTAHKIKTNEYKSTSAKSFGTRGIMIRGDRAISTSRIAHRKSHIFI